MKVIAGCLMVSVVWGVKLKKSVHSCPPKVSRLTVGVYTHDMVSLVVSERRVVCLSPASEPLDEGVILRLMGEGGDA